MPTITDKTLLKGLHFITEASNSAAVFTPEDLTEEHLMIRSTAKEFVKNEFVPVSDQLEAGEHHLNRGLLKTLGDLGMLGMHMPEVYGGMELDTNTNLVVTEEFGRTGAFSTTVGAHIGIGMLPILYYGTEAQKQKYLPSMIAGDKIAAYCLTEPGSGSDALAAKSTAVLSEDGKHYIINGQKMWISNAGFADIFIVFAKINGTDFTGFILEKGMEGLTLGAEEKKLGIKGSSTRQVFFENVPVPVENLLGVAGKGHHIAFNVLNTGRYKIGPAALGGSKGITALAAKYANERHQFGRPISSFGTIKGKIAEMTTQIYAAESIVYRTSGLIQDFIADLKTQGKSYAETKLVAAEEYALESSILKIAMTDIVNFVADESVQIHGGMGFSEETLAARSFRDSRISKIYEGTNEINRLLMLNLLFKRAMKGQFDFATKAMQVQQELMSGENESFSFDNPEEQAVVGFKKIALMLLGSIGQLAMKGKIDLKEEQEIILNLADILIDTFLAESTVLRTQKNPTDHRSAMMQVFLRGATERIRAKASEAIGSFVKVEHQEGYITGVYKFLTYPLINVKDLKRKIADVVLEKEVYVG